MNGLALCAGIGGLELGIHLALGDAYRSVCFVERDAFAAAALVARMAHPGLDSAPVWDDLTTFDGGPWRGRVDLVTAGFPCQPVSLAGSRRAQADDRWIWPHVLRVVREVGPSIVFLENVPGLFGAGFGDVVGGLASLRFDAEWDLFSAAQVGAPHLRERVFILAHRDGAGLGELGGNRGQLASGDDLDRCCSGLAHTRCLERRVQPKRQRGGSDSTDLGNDGQDVAHASGRRRRADERADDVGESYAPGSGVVVGDSDRTRLPIRFERTARPVLAPAFPPGPDDQPAWDRWSGQGGSQPAVRRGADGIPHRVDRLRCLGNAVVPLVAAHAFRTLAQRALR